MTSINQQTLLQVEDLSIRFKTYNGYLTAVNSISFEVKKGEVLALVGESGCGKSITSLAIMGLIDRPGEVLAQNILFNGKNLAALREKEMQKLRGDRISMIFQEPLTSLNPLFRIGHQIDEVFLHHGGDSRAEAKKKSIEMIKKVGIARPEAVYNAYPVELSGGMRQRVMIAIALACNPELLIADEPTTALDVTIQAQILQLMRELQKETHTSIILITHDLGVVAEMADRVAVMYAGRIVEQADVFTLFANPLHPYTEGLIGSTIKVNEHKDILTTIKGTVPGLSKMPDGCRFHPRCERSTCECSTQAPKVCEVEPGHFVECWHYNKKNVVKEETA